MGGDAGWVKGEANVKSGANAFLAFDGDGPPVSGDDIFDNLGPKPGSSRLGTHGPAGKQSVPYFWFHAFARVCHGQKHRLVRFLKTALDSNRSASWHFGNGIIDEIVKSIEEHVLISLNDRQVFQPIWCEVRCLFLSPKMTRVPSPSRQSPISDKGQIGVGWSRL